MNNLAKRALRLHDAGTIELGRIGSKFNTDPGAVLLACVNAGVGVWPIASRVERYCGRAYTAKGQPTSQIRECAVDAALSALEAARA